MNSPPYPSVAPLSWLLGFAVGVVFASSSPAQSGSFDSFGGGSVRPASPYDLPLFFPPPPPTLGSPIPLPVIGASFRRTQTAPPELAEFISDYFYPPLGTRLVTHAITHSQREQLKAYRAAKNALKNELWARLTDLKSAEPEVRAAELARLARDQAPRLAELERTAENLRRELVRGDFFQSNVNWNVIRNWRLGKAKFDSDNDALNAQYQVMLAASFYQNGLLPEQRGLLREIAMELRSVAARRNNDDDSRAVNPPLFFSPATSRLLLPPDLPSETLARIAAYENEKSALKQELREAIYAQDKLLFSRTRTRVVEELAERQWPRIAELEDRAEEIRRDLARFSKAPGPPAAPPLNSALANRIVTFLAERTKLRLEIVAKIAELKETFPFMGIQGGRSGTIADLRVVVNPRNANEEQMTALRAALANFNQSVKLRQASLQQEVESIHRQFESTAAPEDRRSVEKILDDYADVLQQRENWALYGEYQAAMLTPGLSPEQRRVLFASGVEQLDLPLPHWDPSSARIRLVN